MDKYTNSKAFLFFLFISLSVALAMFEQVLGIF